MSNTGSRSLAGKILFVVGVILILIIFAFLIIRFVPKIFSGLANVGSSLGGVFGGQELVVTTSESNLKDGDKFNTAWSYDSNKAGSYSITYGCTDHVNMEIITPAGPRTLICDNAFTLGPNVSNVNLSIKLEKENSFADVPVKVYFTENGETMPSGSGEALVTVQNGVPVAGAEGDLSNAVIESEQVEDDTTLARDRDDESSTNTDNTNYVYINTTPTVTGPADLAVSNVVASNRQVFFTVANIGGSSSGSWLFNYTTPTDPTETFTSPLQISLAPGQSIRYTLTFSEKSSGTQNVTIAVDPFNVIPESSNSNNLGSVNLTGGSFGGGSSSNNGDFDEDDDADFVIEDLEVGRLSGSRFIDDDTADRGDDVAIRFIVRNRGGETTDDWRFEVDDIPYDDDNDYRSREYDGLRPGEEMEIIVEFEDVDDGDYEIEVVVDSEDDTDEERESNNDDTVDLEVDR